MNILFVFTLCIYIQHIFVMSLSAMQDNKKEVNVRIGLKHYVKYKHDRNAQLAIELKDVIAQDEGIPLNQLTLITDGEWKDNSWWNYLPSNWTPLQKVDDSKTIGSYTQWATIFACLTHHTPSKVHVITGSNQLISIDWDEITQQTSIKSRNFIFNHLQKKFDEPWYEISLFHDRQQQIPSENLAKNMVVFAKYTGATCNYFSPDKKTMPKEIIIITQNKNFPIHN